METTEATETTEPSETEETTVPTETETVEEPTIDQTEDDLLAEASSDIQTSSIVDDGICGKYVDWSLDDAGTLTIYGTGDMENRDYGVAAPWADYLTDIKTVVIEEGVTSIGGYAFDGCTRLTSVTIPKTVTKILYSAFVGCSKLTSITIPEGVTDIGSSAFKDCSSLTNITISDSVTYIGTYAFYRCGRLSSITIPKGVTKINDSVFGKCSNLASVTIPEGVTSIGKSAFYQCSSLTSITIPESVTSIGEYAFYNCWSLSSITLPEYMTSIGRWAFSGCSKLTSITIPKGITTIGAITFSGCKKLTSVTIPNGVTSIDSGAFGSCSSLTSISIPNSVTSIGASVFYCCTNLTSLSIPEGVTTIDSRLFYECSSLTSVSIPESVTSIGDEAFHECSNLTDIHYNGDEAQWKAITIGNGNDVLSEVTIHYKPAYAQNGTCGDSLKWVLDTNGTLTISGTGAMYDYNRNGSMISEDSPFVNLEIKKLVFEEGITHIGNCAFISCTGDWGTVVLPESLESIGDEAFHRCTALTGTLVIPKNVRRIAGSNTGTSGLGGNRLTSISVAEGNQYFAVYDGILYTKDLTRLIACPGQRTGTVTFPENLKQIDPSAFFGCSGLTGDLIFPEGLQRIGMWAFNSCTGFNGKISLPDSLQRIELSAFVGCSGITGTLTLPHGIFIDRGVFQNCTGLTEVHIPGDVTFLGDSIFGGCEHIETIYFEGTEAQWNRLEDKRKDANYTGPVFGYIPSFNVYGNDFGWGALEFNHRGWECMSGTLTIDGSDGVIPNYSPENPAPWSRYQFQNLVIDGYITRVGNYAFQGHSELTNVKFNNRVTSIGAYAFDGCTGLQKVDFSGSQEERNDLAIAKGNDSFVNVDWIYHFLKITGELNLNGGLTSGQSTQLTAKMMPDGTVLENVEWYLPEEYRAYATLSSDGVLTAKTVYQAVEIAVWAIQEDYGRGGTSFYIRPKATGLTIDQGTNLTVDMHQTSTLPLTATASPSDAAQRTNWTTSDKSVATVSETGVVTLQKPGTVTITAKTTDGANRTAKITLTVYYLDTAKTLNARSDAPATGLQPGQTAQLTVTGTKVLDAADLSFSIPENQQHIATVDDAGVVTAGNTPGTATVTVTIRGDKLSRKATCKITTISYRAEAIRLYPTVSAPAETGTHGEELLVFLDARDVQEQSFQFVISALGQNYLGGSIDTTVTWVSGNTAIATVTDNKDGTATVTVKKGTSGECAITATSKDAAKVSVNLWISVRDYAPRLESTSLSMNLYQTSTVEIGLGESYENSITDVSIDGDFDATWADGTLTITAQDGVKKGTYTQTLGVTCANGETYEYTLKIKVTETAPTVTIKQSGKYNLFYTDGTTTLTVTAKGATVENVTVTDGNFSGEYADGTLTLTCNGVANPSKKVTLEIQVAGYEKSVEKTVTLSTVTTAPKLKLSTTSSVINTALSTDPSASFQIINSTTGEVLDPIGLVSCDSSFVRMDIQDSTITLSLVAASGYYRCLANGLNIRNVPSTSGAITGTLTKGQRVQILRTAEVAGTTWGYMNAPAKGWVVMDYLASSDDAYSAGTVTLSVQADNWAKAVKLTHKITIQTTLPTMKLGTTTLKLNKVFPELTGETALSLSQSNVPLADVTVTPKTSEAGKIDVSFENGKLVAEITDGSIKTGTYSYTCVGVLENGDPLKAVTLKITVSATSPKIKLASTTLKLNRYLAGAEQVSTKVTVPAGYTLAGFDGLEGTPLTYADGYLTACLEDESDNGGSYAIYPIVVPNGGEEKVTLSTKLTVKVTTYRSSSLSATVTTKGKLDTLNPDSAITCIVKLKNCTGPISGVSLSGQDGDLFHAETNESGNVILTLKEGENYATNKTYKVILDMLVCGQTVSKAISFKVTQSALKLAASPATLTCYQATGRVATILTVTSPATAQIADVTLGSKTTAAFRKALGEDGLHFDAETGKLTLILQNPGLLTPGKSYTLYLDVTPQGNAENVKPTQVKLTVKVQK